MHWHEKHDSELRWPGRLSRKLITTCRGFESRRAHCISAGQRAKTRLVVEVETPNVRNWSARGSACRTHHGLDFPFTCMATSAGKIAMSRAKDRRRANVSASEARYLRYWRHRWPRARAVMAWTVRQPLVGASVSVGGSEWLVSGGRWRRGLPPSAAVLALPRLSRLAHQKDSDAQRRERVCPPPPERKVQPQADQRNE